MSVNRVIPSALLGALLVACSTAPVSPVEPASQSPSPSPAVTPAPTGTEASPLPSQTPTPSPSPSYSTGGSSKPATVYAETDLGGLAIRSSSYTPLPTEAGDEPGTYRGTARMSVQVNGQTRMVQFTELDRPVDSDGFDTLKVTDGDNERTFGADQDFINFWVSRPVPPPSYRVLTAPTQSPTESPTAEPTVAPPDGTEPPEGALYIRALPSGQYQIGRYSDGDYGEYYTAANVEEAAQECVEWRDFSEASLASLSGIYAAMRARESKFAPEPSASPGEYRLRSFRSGQTRFPMPPSIDKKTGGKISFKYRLLTVDEPTPSPSPTLNAGAALLKEIIRLRLEALATPSPLPTPSAFGSPQ